MTNSHCTHPGGPAYCKSPSCPGKARYEEYKKSWKPANLASSNKQEKPSYTDEMFIYNNSEFYEEIQNEVEELLDYAEEIEFYNHGDYKKEFMSLSEVIKNPKKLRGNCLPISDSILENIELSDYDTYLITLTYNRGTHTAIAIAEGEVEFVLDFSMRQFDADAPIPVITSKTHWEDMIDGYINNVWLDSRK